MTSLKQQIEKKSVLAGSEEMVYLDDVFEALVDYMCIPRKQFEELCKRYGEEPHVKRTSAYKAISVLLEDSKKKEQP